jgi:hypothetical protein
MLKKTIAYTDYDGNERKEEFYFNLSKAELAEMELGVNGGVSKLLQKIVDEKDNKRLVEWFKKFIIKAYGVKSLDGKRFIKNEDVLNDFVQTEAYVELFMELASDDKAAADFVNGIVPTIK